MSSAPRRWHTPCDIDQAMPDVDLLPATPWTCPFCALLCDEFALDIGPAVPTLAGSTCPRALAALATRPRDAGTPAALVDGAAVSLDDALDTAARRLAAWRQPLFGGLGLDVGGARALHRLAVATHAICDAADGDAWAHGLRALQDRGQATTTLAEIHARADRVVCVGTPVVDRFPEFFRRTGIGRAGGPCRELVFLGTTPPPPLPGTNGPAVTIVDGARDLLEDLRLLAALLARRRVREPPATLAALADRLLAGRYAVFVWEAARLPAPGALALELLTRLVGTLNRSTRAATFGLAGVDGVPTVNQVFAWRSGLPLRTRVTAGGLVEHEPLRFDGGRLLADRAVDGLLWTSAFDATRVPPPEADPGLPRVILGPPAMAARLREAAAGSARSEIFLPVATPGFDTPGHLVRADGVVVVPLVAVRDDGLPTAAALLDALHARLAVRPDTADRPAGVAVAGATS